MRQAAAGPLLVDEADMPAPVERAARPRTHVSPDRDTAPEPRPASDRWLASVLEELPLAVYTTDTEGRVTWFNRAAATFVGREPVVGEDRWCVTHRLLTIDGVPFPEGACAMAQALRERRKIRGADALAERPDGSRIPFTAFPTPLFTADGDLVGGLNLMVDISRRKSAERMVAHLAQHDHLTGLPNRQMLGVELARRVAEAAACGQRLAVMRIDLDQLKAFNDEHGPAIGDAILVEAARRLRTAVADAFLARIGGDEFILVSARESSATAWPLAERVLGVFAQPFACGGMSLPVTISAGCARFPEDGADETRVLAAAHAALKLAKESGGGCLRLFDPAEQERRQQRAELRKALRRAIEVGEIRLHCQPLFRSDGSVAAFEALARWTDPVLGVVSPAVFIPAAEETGLISALGEHVLRSACREAAGWAQPLRIAVNLSPIEFQSDTLPDLVEAVLAETGLAAERLELEITERVMVTDADRAMVTIARLRALGVRVALDDFGIGYSSLSYLHRFPLTTLKIDRSFIATLGTTPESVPITRAIIQLGHALGMEVVAEGIETPEQLDFLIQEGCDLTQGYLLGRPMEPHAYAHVTGA